MLQRIKLMECEGRWSEIRQMDSAIMAGLSGADMARALLALGKAYEVTATGGADYRTALRHSEAVLSAVPAGHLLHTWALHRIACQRADLGDFAGAEKAAVAFLADVDNHESAKVLLPWVLFHLGRVRHYQGRYNEAVHQFADALASGAQGEIEERIRLFRAWSLSAAGRVTEAFASIPSDVQHVSRGHIFAALARVCLSSQDFQGARLNARIALRSFDAGEWSTFDYVQAAELCLIQKQAALAEGRPAEAGVWFDKCAAILAPWSEGLLFALTSTLGMRGGEQHEAVYHSRGDSAGLKPCGLRGAVG